MSSGGGSFEAERAVKTGLEYGKNRDLGRL
jgi:hypothetical protein